MDRSREEKLVKIMSAGFERAARSFSNLINRKVKVTRCSSVMMQPSKGSQAFAEETGQLYVLVTQIIGDVSGKSFLIFSQDESEEVFKAMNLRKSNEALNEAFLLEIDNIISASVIAELSESLCIEVYGDVPELFRVAASDLKRFVATETGDDNHANVIFCNTTFQFDERESIHPQFVWNLGHRIFDAIPV